MKKIILLIIIVAMAWDARAQQREVYLPLDSCSAWALEHQAAMKNAVFDVELAKETRKAALTKYFPSIYLSAGWFHAQSPLVDVKASENSDKIEVTMNVEGAPSDIESLVREALQQASFDARLQLFEKGIVANAIALQPIFAGGRIVNGNKLAELGVRAAELKLLMTTDEVEMNVKQYYWRIVSLKAKQQTLEQALQMLDTLRRDAVAAREAGVIGNNDLLKVRLKTNELQASAIQLSNGIELATMALCQYVGIDYDEDALYVFDSIRNGGEPSVDKAQWSVENRTESQLLSLAVEAARLQKAMTMGEALPQLSIGASYGLNNLMESGFKGNGMVFATLTVPLTAWWENTHKTRKAELERQQAEQKRDDLCQQMALQVRQAWNEMDEAYRQISLRQQAAEDAQENLQEVQQYYHAGLQSMSDMMEAQTLLQQARNEWIDQLITFQLKAFRYQQLTQGRQL